MTLADSDQASAGRCRVSSTSCTNRTTLWSLTRSIWRLQARPEHGHNIQSTTQHTQLTTPCQQYPSIIHPTAGQFTDNWLTHPSTAGSSCLYRRRPSRRHHIQWHTLTSIKSSITQLFCFAVSSPHCRAYLHPSSRHLSLLSLTISSYLLIFCHFTCTVPHIKSVTEIQPWSFDSNLANMEKTIQDTNNS